MANADYQDNQDAVFQRVYHAPILHPQPVVAAASQRFHICRVMWIKCEARKRTGYAPPD